MLHSADPLPHAFSDSFEKRNNVCNSFVFDQHPQKNDDHKQGNYDRSNHIAGNFLPMRIMGRVKKSIDKIGVETRLYGEGDRKNSQQGYRVNDPFKNNGADQFVRWHFFIPRQQGAFQYFAQPGNSLVGKVTDHHSKKSVFGAWVIAQ